MSGLLTVFGLNTSKTRFSAWLWALLKEMVKDLIHCTFVKNVWSMEMFVHGNFGLLLEWKFIGEGGTVSFYCLRAVDPLPASFKGIFHARQANWSLRRNRKSTSDMSPSQQTGTAAGLGGDESTPTPRNPVPGFCVV